MDRREAVARFLGAAALLLLAGASGRTALPIREARWLPDEHLAEALTEQPAECLTMPRDGAQRQAIAIGRTAFRSPLLLGGQAARAGLSCASCHRNGRGNPHFRFPGVSGELGTADVTLSLFSKHRGDGTFNPKPIPDLAGDPNKLRFESADKAPELRAFIRGLIVEEFDGPDPPEAVLDGLTAYVRALDQNVCPPAGGQQLTLESMLAGVDDAVNAARSGAKAGDSATAQVMLSAARAMLGAIDERFQLPGLEAARTELAAASADLRRLQRTSSLSEAIFAGWDRRWPVRQRQLHALKGRSLFSPAVLARALSARP